MRLIKIWQQLRMCWTFPDADQVARSSLLSRQMRALFRLVPIYVIANNLSAVWLLLDFGPVLNLETTVAWFAVFLTCQIGWATHAWRRRDRFNGSFGVKYSIRDLWISAFWWACTAVCSGVGLCLIAPYLYSDSHRMLIVSFVPGFIAVGALASFTLPILSTIWIGVLIPAACIMVQRMSFLDQKLEVVFLLLYAVVLFCAILSSSRMFVGRVEAELAADRERRVVGLLLGDFETQASDWLWETDLVGRITRAGSSMSEALGWRNRSIVGLLLPSLFAQDRLLTVPSDKYVGAEVLRNFLQNGIAFSGLVVEAEVGGELRSWRIAAKPLQAEDGAGEGWRGIGNAVSDARAREAEGLYREHHLYHLATHDALTELPNRSAFFERLDSTLAQDRSAACHSFSGVLLIDLDNFKTVNDALGHSVGDTVLKHVASRLNQAMGPNDFLARLGGDEFAALISAQPEQRSAAFIEKQAKRVIQQLRHPEMVEYFRIDVRGSIGAVVANDVSVSSGELMRKADIALYAAKSAGRDQHKIYADSMGTDAKGRLSIVSDLALAIERNELSMVYQCIVDASTLRVNACEALMRWYHPHHGAISPVDFIPVAEECGLIVPIGLWALEQACQAAARWPQHVRIAVNVSALQLSSHSFVQSVLDCVARAGIEADRVELEITESSVVSDNVAARLVLDELRRAGIRIALDDFGTGYSSMIQVRELPIDKLKLDRSFVVGLNGARADSSRSIIASLLHMCSLMQLSVTAEGIETIAELTVLRELGCESTQGYLFSKPVDAARIDAVLRADFAPLVSMPG